MAKTIASYTLDGSNREFTIPFEYLARKFIIVTLVGTTRVELNVLDDYRFTQKDQITLNRAWGPSDGFTTVEIRRVTSATDRLVNFSDGSILRAYDLNISQIQAIHIAEEGRDISDSALIQNGIRWNALGFPISNLGEPQGPTDAATKGYVDDRDGYSLRSSAKVRAIPDDRELKVLGFDSQGQPIALTPANGTATDILLQLANPEVGPGLIAFERRELIHIGDKVVEAILAASSRSIWEKRHLVTSRPVLIDPNTWDWWPAIQSAVDEGGPWFFPNYGSSQAIYLISRSIDIRWNRRLSLFGQTGNRCFSRIATTTTFTDRSMVRQWTDDWYAVGETNKDNRPADLGPYSGRIDRYFNARFLEFYIQSDLGGEVTCLDMVALQETSFLGSLIFSGLTSVEKGYPVRIRTGGGAEVSMNGSKIADVVVYGQKWRAELVCKGSGSDLDVDNWVTANSDHKESPFQTSMIDVTMRNIHCEAYSTGKSTFLSEGGGLSVSQSLVVVRNLQGDVYEASGPLTLSQLILYPSGGNSSNVTNKDTINVVRDFMVSNTRLLPWQLKNMGTLARIVSYSRDTANVSDTAGSTLTINQFGANLVLPNRAVCTAAEPFTIPYRLRGATDPLHAAEVILFGRKTSTGAAATLRLRLTQSNNFAGSAPRAFKILENDGWPADVAVALVGDNFVVSTADVTGVVNIKATAHGSIFFNAVNQ